MLRNLRQERIITSSETETTLLVIPDPPPIIRKIKHIEVLLLFRQKIMQDKTHGPVKIIRL